METDSSILNLNKAPLAGADEDDYDIGIPTGRQRRLQRLTRKNRDEEDA
jgi:hypothetical protein